MCRSCGVEEVRVREGAGRVVWCQSCDVEEVERLVWCRGGESEGGGREAGVV